MTIQSHYSRNFGRVKQEFMANGDGHQAFRVRWLDILSSSWRAEEDLEPQSGLVRLVTPTDSGYWAAIINPGLDI